MQEQEETEALAVVELCLQVQVVQVEVATHLQLLHHKALMVVQVEQTQGI
tara:strand:- start:257 stop:406 length:150 start_codon:yes stop_codon:yes gene_type:complete